MRQGVVELHVQPVRVRLTPLTGAKILSASIRQDIKLGLESSLSSPQGKNQKLYTHSMHQKFRIKTLTHTQTYVKRDRGRDSPKYNLCLSRNEMFSGPKPVFNKEQSEPEEVRGLPDRIGWWIS